jgi:prepilin-type N-terminal cleavage/methylation domain-containing protein
LGCSARSQSTLKARKGFTVVELLVVTGIVGTLASVILPALTSARAESRAVACLSNLHQISTALTAYANDNQGRFPQNLTAPSPGQYWCDADRIGHYLPTTPAASGGVGGGVLICPSDDGAARSYSMNIWASCKIDPYMTSETPPRGSVWMPQTASSDLILVADSWSWVHSRGTDAIAPPTIGYAGLKPGLRFGGAGGISPPVTAGPWGKVASELPFSRHRSSRGGSMTAPKGRVGIGYADGHAALKRDDELTDPMTGESTFDSLWSKLDRTVAGQ